MALPLSYLEFAGSEEEDLARVSEIPWFEGAFRTPRLPCCGHLSLMLAFS